MQSPRIEGLWLPLITPFRDGALDERSLRRMVRHYLGQPVDGMILAATTDVGVDFNLVSWLRIKFEGSAFAVLPDPIIQSGGGSSDNAHFPMFTNSLGLEFAP